MKVEKKTKKELIEELAALRQKVAELEESEARSRQTEIALKSERDKLQALMDGLARTDIGIDIVGIDYKIQVQNQVLKERFGDSAGKLCYEAYMGLKHPCGFCPMIAAIEENVVKSVELTGVDGKDYELISAPIPKPDGTIDKVIEVVLDITERKQAEERIRDERDKAQRYLDIAGVVLIVINADSRVSLVNKKGCEVLGYEEHEIIGKDWFKNFLPERLRNEVSSVFEDLMAGHIEPVEYFENPVLTKSGEERTIAWHNAALRNKDGKITAVLSSGEDITERKQLQEQLQHATKMEAIGRLSGGVAHDFNNSLIPVLLISEMLLKEMTPDNPMYEDIKDINEAGERCANLTRQLLAFGRRQIIEPKILNLNNVVKNIEKMLGHVINKDIELVKLLEPDLGHIKADLSQVEQIITNLAINARDAMPQGGKLTIETRNVYLDEEYAKGHPYVTPGPYVMFAVSDTGVGISEEARAHAFEPFFSTKENGKGTGLGLSTVYGIVKQSGGDILIHSEPGAGTTFKIYMPRVEEVKEKVKPDKTAIESLRGSETILLVEDEDSVRKVAKRILEQHGYNILEARNGEVALKIHKQHKESIKLMITDVVMPGMSGKELADRISSLNPSIKVIYISGYTYDTIFHHGVLEGGIRFIQKPFTTESLMRKVREVLEDKNTQ